NPDVVAEMEAAGARRAQKRDEVTTPIVLLTAHGTAERVKLKLVSDGFEVHDAACPLVRRGHLGVKKLVQEGRHPGVIGKPDHVEVRGLTGDLDEFTVVQKEADVEKLAGRAKLGIVAQTTQPLERVLELVGAIRARFPEADVKFIDTVCQPTKDRQNA